MNPWLRRNGPLLVLLLVTTLAYARLWGVGWSWDDEALILDNQVTGSLSNIGEFFTRDLWGTTRLESLKSGYYRPLFLLSLAIDRALFGLSSAAAHVHSLLWHLLVVVGLHGLIRKLVNPAAALTAATLFALHPVNVEVLALAQMFGLNIVEVPVDWTFQPMHRVSPLLDGPAMLAALFRIRTRLSTGRYAPLQVGRPADPPAPGWSL